MRQPGKKRWPLLYKNKRITEYVLLYAGFEKKKKKNWLTGEYFWRWNKKI